MASRLPQSKDVGRPVAVPMVAGEFERNQFGQVYANAWIAAHQRLQHCPNLMGLLRGILESAELLKIVQGNPDLVLSQRPVPFPQERRGHAPAPNHAPTAPSLLAVRHQIPPPDDEDLISRGLPIQKASGINQAGVRFVMDAHGGKTHRQGAGPGIGEASVEAHQDAEAAQGGGDGEDEHLDAKPGAAEEQGELGKVVGVAAGALDEHVEAARGDAPRGHDQPAAGVGAGGGGGEVRRRAREVRKARVVGLEGVGDEVCGRRRAAAAAERGEERLREHALAGARLADCEQGERRRRRGRGWGCCWGWELGGEDVRGEDARRFLVREEVGREV